MPAWAQRPDHVGQDGLTTPFLSSWYICAQGQTEAIASALDEKIKPEVSPEWVVARTSKGTKWKIQKHLQEEPTTGALKKEKQARSGDTHAASKRRRVDGAHFM
jgi:hypothetical protein